MSSYNRAYSCSTRLAVREVVLRLLHHRLVQVVPVGDVPRGADLAAGPLRRAPVERLPAAHDVGHRAHGLLERRVRVGAVAEEEVDEVEAEAVERPVDRLHEVLAVQRVLHVGCLVQAPEHLRGDDVRPARPVHLRDRRAHDALGLAACVRLRVVEEVHARVVGRLHALARLLHAHLVLERHPRTEREHADLEAGTTQPSIFHPAHPTGAGARSVSARWCSAVPRGASTRQSVSSAAMNGHDWIAAVRAGTGGRAAVGRARRRAARAGRRGRARVGANRRADHLLPRRGGRRRRGDRPPRGRYRFRRIERGRRAR